MLREYYQNGVDQNGLWDAVHMDIYFRPTTLFNTLVMLVLLFGGLGVIARSLRSVSM